MKLLRVNPKTKVLSICLFVGQFTILGLFPSCDKEEVKPATPSEKTSVSQTEEPDELVHQVPEIPILLDGIAAPPTDVLKYNGKPLFYFLDEKSGKEGVLHIFTTQEKAKAYRLQVESEYQISSAGNPNGRTASTNGFTAEIVVYLENSHSGNSYTYDLGKTDLARLSQMDCGLFGCTNLHNKISSIKCAKMPYHWTVLFDNFYYKGSQFWIRPGANKATLPGFNDKTSSIGFVPYTLH